MYVRIANADDAQYTALLCEWYEESARMRKTGIAKRNPVYLERKMRNGNAVIAFDDENQIAGFSYIETYEEEKFVVNSGLIVRTDLRSSGIGKEIKKAVFALSRTKFPNSKIFSITTSLAVMRMNARLGYMPVTFSELTQSDEFWNGCKSCKNYHILMENERERCICTGLVYDNLNDEYGNKARQENNSKKDNE
ncbi:GNAT family N-acetyltransferase [Faecalibacter rhinopitheci]|uniref:GNAT family N-acetyltransferase n=1 Tax=Faecalibacter rhinopitheci TaxID=2779678 RepID=A0A8J7FRA2_9FLAO|nr:GNAT family N-acetyltransferase [Faecalibacter rhinopitheci]MBF0598134.1 GNAT family N-acetyltransferase [Faecalibacter rhinopitheci]